jgi:hypothetical protein
MNEILFYITEGFYHVLDLRVNSYDHVLFFILMAVPYTFSSLKQVFYISLAFTLGHTLSILLAVYAAISVNTGHLEFIILLTILVTAIYNILTAGKNFNSGMNYFILILTLLFGIVHGFGFAGAFKMLASGVENKFLLLLEFALGIELGQLLVILIVLILGFLAVRLIRVARRDWILVTSAITIGMIIPLLIQRWIF